MSKMGKNLPPGVSISDSDAPWNQRHPEPGDINVECKSCDFRGKLLDTPRDETLTCPDCGEGVIRSG
jgi:hypothetical protein